MRKVSIFIILTTLTIMTVQTADDYREFSILLCLCLLFYVFGFYLIKKIDLYFQKKRFEDDISKIFDDDFLLRLKKELTPLKLQNELKKISSSELCTDQTENDTKHDL